MQRILIVGGTFDPIHNDHLRLAEQLVQRFGLDSAWFLIAKTPRWKRGVTPSKTRLLMLEMALQPYPNFQPCTLELEQKAQTVNYTYDSMVWLQNNHPNSEFYFMIGSDQLAELHRWKNIDQLASMVQFLLVERENYPILLENLHRYHVINTHIKGSDLSSTLIRSGKSMDVPSCIQEYMTTHGVYFAKQIKQTLTLKRYQHSKSVATIARKIARANQMDVHQAYVAGILHDCAKELSQAETYNLMNHYFPNDIHRSPQIYHQLIGGVIAKKNYHVKDPEILNAIATHATAAPTMSKLSKLLYCADKIEPSRNYDSSHLFESCLKDIDLGFCKVLNETIQYLTSKNIPIDPATRIAQTNYPCKEGIIE